MNKFIDADLDKIHVRVKGKNKTIRTMTKEEIFSWVKGKRLKITDEIPEIPLEDIEKVDILNWMSKKGIIIYKLK